MHNAGLRGMHSPTGRWAAVIEPRCQLSPERRCIGVVTAAPRMRSFWGACNSASKAVSAAAADGAGLVRAGVQIP